MPLKLLFIAILFLSGCAIEQIDGEEYVVSTVRYGEGEISPASVSVFEGERATLVLTPAEGWVLVRAEGCNGELLGNQFITGRIRANCSVRVWFEQTSALTITMAFSSENGIPVQVTFSPL
ncbi:hypothetical protein CWE13_10710 [Aliidiomarina shirensis]|uniref:Uncharacterized protein n=1 Tax=Aliidiomarina shirensis TaxID=1048642 RepID=A0A432WQF6_9GAMM|nr:hypothetical protein [Aliidiomarina shirensis]RUO36004.1 hypothetical protein CWE13_10710 [Aliidiomarina shirensis]